MRGGGGFWSGGAGGISGVIVVFRDGGWRIRGGREGWIEGRGK